jgi:hypothetical protein
MTTILVVGFMQTYCFIYEGFLHKDNSGLLEEAIGRQDGQDFSRFLDNSFYLCK